MLVIRLNFPQSQPSLFLFGTFYPPRCYSTLVNYISCFERNFIRQKLTPFQWLYPKIDSSAV